MSRKQLHLVTNRSTWCWSGLQLDCNFGRVQWREPIETFQLPSVLDLNAASGLREQFVGRRGSALRVDASRVERLGGLCLQVLIAAQAAWAEDRNELTFEDLSSELQSGLTTFGVPAPALNFREE